MAQNIFRKHKESNRVTNHPLLLQERVKRREYGLSNNNIRLDCIRGYICLSVYLLAIVGKIIFDAATADYKLYKHVRLCRKRLLRKRYEDYAWLLLQLEKDTEIFNLTHNTRDWTFEDWSEFYLKKAKEDKQ